MLLIGAHCTCESTGAELSGMVLGADAVKTQLIGKYVLTPLRDLLLRKRRIESMCAVAYCTCQAARFHHLCAVHCYLAHYWRSALHSSLFLSCTSRCSHGVERARSTPLKYVSIALYFSMTIKIDDRQFMFLQHFDAKLEIWSSINISKSLPL